MGMCCNIMETTLEHNVTEITVEMKCWQCCFVNFGFSLICEG